MLLIQRILTDIRRSKNIQKTVYHVTYRLLVQDDDTTVESHF